LSELLNIVIELEPSIKLISVGIMFYLISKGLEKVFNGDYKN